MDFASNVSSIHGHVHENLQVYYAKYKASADHHGRDVHFQVGEFIWAVLTRDCFHLGEYNKHKSCNWSTESHLGKYNKHKSCNWSTESHREDQCKHILCLSSPPPQMILKI